MQGQDSRVKKVQNVSRSVIAAVVVQYYIFLISNKRCRWLILIMIMQRWCYKDAAAVLSKLMTEKEKGGKELTSE